VIPSAPYKPNDEIRDLMTTLRIEHRKLTLELHVMERAVAALEKKEAQRMLLWQHEEPTRKTAVVIDESTRVLRPRSATPRPGFSACTALAKRNLAYIKGHLGVAWNLITLGDRTVALSVLSRIREYAENLINALRYAWALMCNSGRQVQRTS
jgi:hypothetical protein